MKVEIKPRDRRALIGLVGALLIYGVLVEAVFPVWDGLRGNAETVIDKESQLARYRRALVRQELDVEAEDTLEEQVAALSGRLIQADNASLASVELQSLVERAAGDAGLSFDQRDIVGVRGLDDFFNETAMTMMFSATPYQFGAFLAGLRSVEPFLTIRALEVTPVDPVTEPVEGRDVTKDVRVRMTVAGLLER